jgi:hypothetical protein
VNDAHGDVLCCQVLSQQLASHVEGSLAEAVAILQAQQQQQPLWKAFIAQQAFTENCKTTGLQACYICYDAS